MCLPLTVCTESSSKVSTTSVSGSSGALNGSLVVAVGLGVVNTSGSNSSPGYSGYEIVVISLAVVVVGMAAQNIRLRSHYGKNNIKENPY